MALFCASGSCDSGEETPSGYFPLTPETVLLEVLVAAVRAFGGFGTIASHCDLALLSSWRRLVLALGVRRTGTLATGRTALETAEGSGPAEYRSVVAVRAGGPEVLEVVRRTLPELRRGEVRVAVEACGVSAVDVQMRQGLSTYPPRFPFTPGYTAVGVVDAVGKGVTAVTPGDRVVVLTETGGYAEYVFVRRYPMMRIPADLDEGEVVAVALNYLVAYQALSRAARIRRGQVVLVTGAAGGIGTAIVQLGQLLGLRMYGVADVAKHPWLTDHGVVPLGSQGAEVVGAVRRLEPEGWTRCSTGWAVSGWSMPWRCSVPGVCWWSTPIPEALAGPCACCSGRPATTWPGAGRGSGLTAQGFGGLTAVRCWRPGPPSTRCSRPDGSVR